MAWSDPIDIYCERTDPSFWAEPVNASSNIGFLVAAGLAFRHWHARGGRDLPTLGLILLVALIGIGSFAFHTVANEAASLADVIPITLFVLAYLYLAMRRFLHLSALVSILLLAAFLGASAVLPSLPPEIMNGSDAYLPPLAALVAIGLLAPEPSVQRSLLVSATILSVSLAFRTIDLAVCATLPVGTHFIWHLINALVLYRLVEAALSAESGLTARKGGLASPRG